MLFLLVHSLYKGALFMVAGAIDHATGTRDIRHLGGLIRITPILTLAAILAALSMSGIPLFLGFLGKEFIYEAALGYESGEALHLTLTQGGLVLAALLTNIAFVGVALLVTIPPFLGHNDSDHDHHPHAPSLLLWLGPLALAVVGLLLGIMPGYVAELLGKAAGAVTGHALELHLAPLPYGLTPMLLLSVITLACGAVVYLARHRLQKLYDMLNPSLSAEGLYDSMVHALPYRANDVTRVIQSGHLRYYIATIVGVAMMLIVYTYFAYGHIVFPADTLRRITDLHFHELIIALVIMAGLVSVMRARSLMVMIVSLGVIGYGVAVIFILFGAPDLAMTQFAIETLSVILFVLVLYRLPGMAWLSTRRARMRDSVLAMITGGIITMLVLTITDQPLASGLKDFFAQASYTIAHGHNIVNVILVDFRGFDTMGEITVLGIAAIGIFGLLKLRIGTPKESAAPEEDDEN